MRTDIELGTLLRQLRTKRDEPLRVVAASAGIDSTLLSRIERGDRLPTPPQLDALAAHFGVPPEELRPLNNAARMMRSWNSVDEVLDAADVLESRSNRTSGRSRVPRFAAMKAPAASDLQEPPPRDAEPPTVDAMRMPSPSAPSSAVRSAAWMPHPLTDQERAGSTRSDRLADLEEAAAAGAAAAYTLSAATADPDSVVALRAAELLRQMRSRLG